ncbi:MAG: hypothetical protein B7Z77_01985 [Acidocella sp. 20-58-15]|nr:MAG: hypothetical protein B7Z77_01985 [Acidocella sp. 20-58-15]
MMSEITEHQVIAAIAAKGGIARLLGGRAIHAVCGASLPATLKRHSADIDLVTRGRDRKALKAAMTELGCVPEQEFNLLNGKERMMFHAGETKIDIFIDVFRMCHTLQLGHRLEMHPLTLSPADLLLTKLQVFHAERKDLSDTAALLLACGLGPEGLGAIDTNYIAKLLGSDWGFWRTASGTLKTLDARAEEICGTHELAIALQRHITELLQVLETAPRSLSWRMRAVIGERSPWYELPEEPDVDHLPTTA